MAAVDLSPVLGLLEQRREEGWHTCAQVYVSLGGEVLLDAAVGETRPGRAARTDDVMLWYSAGKPLTTVAVLQLWERGRLGLDDRVGQFLPGWGAGKERCTLRHVLTHTGGFPMFGDQIYDKDVTFAEALAATVAAPAAWEPGTEAAYHPSSGWRVLGGVVEAVDGRPIERYLGGGGHRAGRDGVDVARHPALGAGRARGADRAGGVDRASDAEAGAGRRDPDGPLQDRPLAQRAVAHREGRPGGRDAGPGPGARPGSTRRCSGAGRRCSSRGPSR